MWKKKINIIHTICYTIGIIFDLNLVNEIIYAGDYLVVLINEEDTADIKEKLSTAAERIVIGV